MRRSPASKPAKRAKAAKAAKVAKAAPESAASTPPAPVVIEVLTAAAPEVSTTVVPDSPATLWEKINCWDQMLLIAGPCVIESEELCVNIARELVPLCAELGIFFIFKASYDKANRTSGQSFRGPGAQAGLHVLRRIREEFGVPVLTDVHTAEQAVEAAACVDILQIPAFLCRQTDLIEAAVCTGRIVNVKKGQFLSPREMGQVVQKVVDFGGSRVMITERGTTFGYNNLVTDMRAIPIMKRFGCPVIFDATHSVQLPGGAGDRSAGQREFAPVLAKCALAAGADGIFIETHPDPDNAMSDGPNMIPLAEMRELLPALLRVRAAVR